MPWVIEKDAGACSKDKPFAVKKQDKPGGPGGAVVAGGCHATRQQGLAHMRALYANVPEAKAAKMAEELAPTMSGLSETALRRLIAGGSLIAEDEYARKFTQAQRDKAAKSGDALSDGSFVIYTQEDLDNAVNLVGNSNHPASTVKAHIRKQAKKHGLKLPDSWS